MIQFVPKKPLANSKIPSNLGSLFFGIGLKHWSAGVPPAMTPEMANETFALPVFQELD